ncbi:MAG: hypothetical protein MUF61_01185 [archaeon]|jgi:uncharacterized protein (UPF0333 family)|nr:hypothetical protein [archaeon]
MKEEKRGQISTEYLIVVGFIVFFVIISLGVALYYSADIQDKMRERQIEQFARKIIGSAEEVYYSGEPSKSTINIYLPKGVSGISVFEKEIAINFSLSTGFNSVSYSSNVPLEGVIGSIDGVRTIEVTALSDRVMVAGN